MNEKRREKNKKKIMFNSNDGYNEKIERREKVTSIIKKSLNRNIEK